MTEANGQCALQMTEQGAADDAEEYLAFLKKFEAKKTTDDCYTPPKVYEAVRNWAVGEYGLHGKDIVRPFHPDGDFERYAYQPDDVVIDNPPFSIMARVIQVYTLRGVPFFLFAPGLVPFSSAADRATTIIVDASIKYDNGALVPTAFVTNLDVVNRVRSAPELRAAILLAQEEGKERRSKYTYPPNVITAARLSKTAGIAWAVPKAECSQRIPALQSQRAEGKTLFGDGYLVSDKVAAELKAAELKAAEEPIIWALSPAERAVIRRLGGEASADADPHSGDLFA